MQFRDNARPPVTLFDRVRAPLAGFQQFVPTLRAYSGFAMRPVSPYPRGVTMGRIGSLEVRLARTAAEVRRAQRLRYRVFYKEMSANAAATAKLAQRDVDTFDGYCDHLLVLDHSTRTRTGKPAIVGTYRLLRQDIAEAHGGFYSAGEFDIGGLMQRHSGVRFVELGRSCVLAPYRNKRTVELLWHGIWTYVLQHNLGAMLGCASLEGTDPDKLALQLSFLHHYARAPEAWRSRALPHRYVEMNRLRRSAIDPKEALHLLPPLIKGYLRIGATFGDGAVIDRQFGTTDVFVVLPVATINARYLAHFGPTAERHAA
ncbi:MAG TPA: GNAT family N-acyltransferase [Xanthobacteraceae bacterium]|nr:GNAT family N-acyltransferase [Xanthobacteraceae bacterium]